MKLIALIVAISALSQTAVAQTPKCQSVAESDARLACYDKAAPPASSATAKSAPPKTDKAKYVDTIGTEDALMNARLKNICRGC
jgi:hypothetical protein